jgi:transposase-like protein
MKQRRSGEFTDEFRAEAVAKVIASGRSVVQMAKELGLDHRTLWQWVNNARLEKIDPGGELTRETRNKIRDLEKENARLRRDLDFEKKAAAFFREHDRGANDSL